MAMLLRWVWSGLSGGGSKGRGGEEGGIQKLEDAMQMKRRVFCQGLQGM